MYEHPHPNELQAYRQRRLPAREILRLDKHLAHCAPCSQTLALPFPHATERLLGALKQPAEHLRYEQLETYVDGRAAEESLDRHLAACARCRFDLAELRALAPVLSRPPARRPAARSGLWWLGVIAVPAAVAVVAMTLGLDTIIGEGPDHATAAYNKQSAPAFDAAYDLSALQELDTVSPAAAAAYRAGDFPALAALLKQPAEQGNISAQIILGLLLAQGRGVVRDPAEAERFWRAAADAGSAAAEKNLAVLRSQAQGLNR